MVQTRSMVKAAIAVHAVQQQPNKMVTVIELLGLPRGTSAQDIQKALPTISFIDIKIEHQMARMKVSMFHGRRVLRLHRKLQIGGKIIEMRTGFDFIPL